MNKSDKSDLEKLYQRRLLDALQLGYHLSDWENLSLFPICLPDIADHLYSYNLYDYRCLFNDLHDELERAKHNKEDKLYLDVIRDALRECADLYYNYMLALIE